MWLFIETGENDGHWHLFIFMPCFQKSNIPEVLKIIIDDNGLNILGHKNLTPHLIPYTCI